jgi:DNA topoisomerase-3
MTCKQTYPDLKGRPDYGKGRNGTPPQRKGVTP